MVRESPTSRPSGRALLAGALALLALAALGLLAVRADDEGAAAPFSPTLADAAGGQEPPEPADRGDGELALAVRAAVGPLSAAEAAAAAAAVEAAAPETGLAGVVVAADGAPEPGASVHLRRPAEPLDAAPGPVVHRTALTDEAGRFRFAGIPAGDGYELRASAGDSVCERLDVAVEAERWNDSGALRLAPGARLRGRVAGPGEVPLEGARVVAGPGLEPMLTGADGRFDFGLVAAGRRSVDAEHAGHAGRGGVTVDLAPGRETDVAIALETARSIFGRVVDPAGAPVAGVQLEAERLDEQPSPFRVSGAAAESRADGSFAIEGLAAGRYDVRARPPGYRSLHASGVEAGREEALVLVLELGAEVRGVAVDAATAEPVEVARFGLERRRPGSPPGQPERAFAPVATAAEGGGRFCLRADVPPGFQFRVVGFAEGRPFATSDWLDLANGGVVEGVELRFERAAALSVAVVAADGAPVQGARVEAWDLPRSADRMHALWGGKRAEAESDASGIAVLPPQPAASLRLVGRKPGFAVTVALAVPPAVAGEPIRMQLARGGTLHGVVRDLDGAPVPGVSVWANGSSGQFATGWTGADGHFRFPHLAAGRYRLSAELDSGEDDVVMVRGVRGEDPERAYAFLVVEGGETIAHLALDTRARGALEGTVRIDGRAQAGLEVLARPLPGPAGFGPSARIEVRNAPADDAGRFRFARLPPGDYFLTVLAGMRAEYEGIECTVAPGGLASVGIDVATAAISGRVVSAATGDPVAAASITAERVALDERRELNQIVLPGTAAAADGTFALEALQAGTYQLRVSAPGHETARLAAVATGTAPIEVRLEPER